MSKMSELDIDRQNIERELIEAGWSPEMAYEESLRQIKEKMKGIR